MENLKYGIWLFWIGCVAAFVLGSGWVASLGSVAFWLTLAAHVVEYFVKRPLFVRAGGSMGHHFVQTLIYGMLHWKPIQERLAEEPLAEPSE